MTCIVSFVDKKKRMMWMGADSMSSYGYIKAKNSLPKVFQNEHYIIGHCGYSKAFSLLQYGNNIPPPCGDLHEFMTIIFADHFRKILDEHDYLKKSDNVSSMGDKHTVFSIAVGGRLFEVFNNFVVEEFDYPYFSSGSGREIALGSLYNDNVSGFLQKDPRESIRASIKAATEFIPSVGGKIKIISKSY